MIFCVYIQTSMLEFSYNYFKDFMNQFLNVYDQNMYYYHPITIILSLIFWGMIWGIIGVLLAAPITAIVKITFKKFETTLPIARLLEGNIHHKRS